MGLLTSIMILMVAMMLAAGFILILSRAGAPEGETMKDSLQWWYEFLFVGEDVPAPKVGRKVKAEPGVKKMRPKAQD
eukprot:CAMPEP_0182523244 /NCGR_PEP_ID=MMETSP1323-20130603/897_1 /TAXON_ID=236787 /ORGANISM="Florenciella parvula, Strain RCC1693" /LENGTH=76 /DNA_ID=CAMNT_0024731561 /DNA_START=72 /DNA_END=302 /DNA_ORIENTATION=-